MFGAAGLRWSYSIGSYCNIFGSNSDNEVDQASCLDAVWTRNSAKSPIGKKSKVVTLASMPRIVKIRPSLVLDPVTCMRCKNAPDSSNCRVARAFVTRLVIILQIDVSRIINVNRGGNGVIQACPLTPRLAGARSHRRTEGMTCGCIFDTNCQYIIRDHQPEKKTDEKNEN